MYQALYRTYRPMTFTDVIGQPDIVNALQNQILGEKIGHAYIFTGTRGTGKTSCAKIMAKAVNCLNTTMGNPCGVCSICKGVEDGSLIDVVEIDAASNSGVDNIRDLKEETAYTPAVATYKVYIIDEVHMLSTAAFNALLKIMEEPPAHIVFVLATTEIHKVPTTILSRCQRFDFMRIGVADISARLESIAQIEGINLDPQASALIAHLADGAMRDALSILDTCSSTNPEVTEETVRTMTGVTDKSYLFEFSNSVSKQDISGAILLLANIRTGCADTKRIVEDLIYHYRNLLLAGLAPTDNIIGTNDTENQKYTLASKETSTADCLSAIKRFGACLERMAKGGDQRIELELALVDLCVPTQTTQTVVVQAPAPVVQQKTETVQPAPVQPQIPPTDNSLVEFEAWGAIIQGFKETDRALHSFLKQSTAFMSGNRVLISAGALFNEYIRQSYTAKDVIKKAILAKTGINYSIGPYTPPKEKVQATTNNALDKLKSLGVEVVEE